MAPPKFFKSPDSRQNLQIPERIFIFIPKLVFLELTLPVTKWSVYRIFWKKRRGAYLNFSCLESEVLGLYEGSAYHSLTIGRDKTIFFF